MDCLDEETVVAFVNGALRGPALAAVERHLVGCPACAALIAVAVPPARTSGQTGTPPPELAVGRYRLLHLVGRGGMGEVYAAHDPELDRRVAIKILRTDARADDVEAARLAREAQAVAKLSHPNVVAIYDVGSSAGRMFLAMELVEGETLALWLAHPTRTTSEILSMFLMAGRGLAAAHRAGIVHRDFKPQNVMVAGDGSARVMDFGLAAAGSGSGQAHQIRLTKAGSILGTPLYMSPEQMVGQPVDPRADQFSFCVALWEALHGARPFEGSSVLELRGDVLAGRPRPGPLRSRVPRRVQAALLRGLSVDRARRFSDMNALLDELTAAPTGAPTRTGAVGVALGLALAGLVVGGVWRARARKVAACEPAPTLADVWETAAEGRRRLDMRTVFLSVANDVPDARERFERVSQMLDRYVGGWSSASRSACEAASHALDDTTSLRLNCLERRRDELAALADVLLHADAKVVRRSIAAVMSLAPVDACADLVVLRSAPLPPYSRELRARVDQLTGRLLTLRASAAAGHDWQALEPIGALTDDVRAASYEPLLVETLLVDGRIRSPFDPEGAIPLYEEAYRRAETLHLDDFAAEAAIQLTAIEGTFQHRFPQGERWASLGEAALEHAGDHERLRGWLFNVRGTLEAAQGQWRRAETDFTSSVSMREQALGAAPPDLAASLVNLSKAKLMLDEAAEARDAAARAFRLARAVFPEEAYEVNAALLARAHALVALERPADARADVASVESSFERTLGRDHPFLADPMTVLGEVALAEERPAPARAVLERAWEIRSTHVTDAGAREETAFALARAIWGSSEGDRPHALELAIEARDGYAQIPDLASRLAVVQRWIDERTDTARHGRR